eukprot:GHVS01037711.1.p1 GENE.GHVS01037711.1~~GHVS01037711.1.p1  ORF type:complete len:193 (+),score=38.17 GHVS01037711.1:165-743(+)
MSGLEDEEVLSVGAESAPGDEQHEEGGRPTVSKAKRRMEEIMKKKRKGATGAAGVTVGDLKDYSSTDCISSPPCSSSAEAPWSHNSYPPITGPSQIEYCPSCGLPPDYCEFSECWEGECRPWVLKNYPEYYPDLVEALAKQSEGKNEVAIMQEDLSNLTFLGGGAKMVGDPLGVDEAPKKEGSRIWRKEDGS